MKYALKTKGKYQFFCLSNTVDELDKNEMKAFNSWKGMQEKGSNKTIDDFREDNDRVKVTIEKI